MATQKEMKGESQREVIASRGLGHETQQQHARRMRAPVILPMVQFALLLLAVPSALSYATESPTAAPSTPPLTPSLKPSAKPSVKPTIAPTAGYTTRRIAGTGAQGFSGDGGLATLAKVANPDSTVLDEFQNLYISDYGNSRVRVVNINGTMSTIAGGGTNAGNSVAATSAQFSIVRGIIALPSSNELLLADSGGNRVVGISLATRAVRTVLKTIAPNCPSNVVDFSATASSLARGPRKMWLDSSDNVYVTNECSTVVKVSPSTGKANIVLGKTLWAPSSAYSDSMLSFDPTAATSVQLRAPTGVWGDSTGNLYVSEANYQAVLRVSLTDNTVMTYIGQSAPFFQGPATFNSYLYDMTGDANGMLYIAAQTYMYSANTNTAQLALSFTASSMIYGVRYAQNHFTLSESSYVDDVYSSTPTGAPSFAPSGPSLAPTTAPSKPTVVPTYRPTRPPSRLPTFTPTVSRVPTACPSAFPSVLPSTLPSVAPTVVPSVTPSEFPTLAPSVQPSIEPSVAPSVVPTVLPSGEPSATPSFVAPSAAPTAAPSNVTTTAPTTACTNSGCGCTTTNKRLKTRVTVITETFYDDDDEEKGTSEL